MTEQCVEDSTLVIELYKNSREMMSVFPSLVILAPTSHFPPDVK